METNQTEAKQIFDALSEVVVDSDFRLAQNSFFEKNCGQFDSEDENKHIYKNIYEEYIKILDEVVESQIMKKLPNAKMDVFFEDLQKNSQFYHTQNSEVMDILFSFADFDKFKGLMLQQRAGMKDVSPETYEQKLEALQSDGDFNYCMELFNEPISAGWKKVIDNKKDQFICYEKKYKDTGLYMMRTNGIMPGISYNTVGKMAGDLDTIREMAKDQIAELKVIEEIPLGRIAPIMSDREFVMKQYSIHNEKEKEITIISQTIQHPGCPETKGVIRAEMIKVSKVKPFGADINSCELNEVMFQDLKGYIPKMLMNMFMSKMAAQGISQFKQSALKYQQKLETEQKK